MQMQIITRTLGVEVFGVWVGMVGVGGRCGRRGDTRSNVVLLFKMTIANSLKFISFPSNL